MTHYEVLGVAHDAPVEEIRRAYLALARRYHPDVVRERTGADRADRLMREINEAWSVLGDATRRARYDRSLPAVDSAPKRGWEPLDDDPDDHGAWDLDLDLLDDHPRGDHGLPTAIQVVPPLTVAAGILCALVGAVTAIPGLLALGAVALAVGAIAVLLFPLLAVYRSRRGERSVSAVADDPG